MAFRHFFCLVMLPVVSLLHSGCENDPAEVDAMIRKSQEIEEAKEIRAIFSQSGKMKAILEAPIMLRVKSDTVYTEFPKSILVTFYNETGGVDDIVKADYARYFEMLRKVYMKDNVTVFSTKGDTLYAEDLWWDQNQELFYSNNPVKVRTPGQKLDGDGITAKSDFSKYTIINPRGPVAIPENINP